MRPLFLLLLCVPFAFAMAALFSKRLDVEWLVAIRKWTLVSWLFLSIGILLGMWWAYVELGWGGYWAWDPVENASLLPWLTMTAFLHSVMVHEKRGMLKKWNFGLIIGSWLLSIFGTFITRSGIISSVHSFATDPTRGVFILGLLVLATGGALTLYAIRAPQMKLGNLFAPVSREGGLILNNILLVAITAVIFLGTFYPLFLQVTSGTQISVGPPFYNFFFVPFAIATMDATTSSDTASHAGRNERGVNSRPSWQRRATRSDDTCRSGGSAGPARD